MTKQKAEILLLLQQGLQFDPTGGLNVDDVADKLAAREKEAQLRAINSLYQSFLPTGYQFPAHLRRIFHDHYNLVSEGQELPEPAREDRSFGKGTIVGAAITLFVVVLIKIAVFISSQPAALQTLPAEQQLNDTLQMNHNISSDSSYLDYRQGSPEANHVFDSSSRAERRAGK